MSKHPDFPATVFKWGTWVVCLKNFECLNDKNFIGCVCEMIESGAWSVFFLYNAHFALNIIILLLERFRPVSFMFIYGVRKLKTDLNNSFERTACLVHHLTKTGL